MTKTSTSNKTATWFRSVLYGEAIIFVVMPLMHVLSFFFGFFSFFGYGMRLLYLPLLLVARPIWKWVEWVETFYENTSDGMLNLELIVILGLFLIYWVFLGLALGSALYFIKQKKEITHLDQS